MAPPDVDLTVYPDDCDSFGHLNQASFLSLFERARWEMLARGPGMDFFTRSAAWPAVRKAEIMRRRFRATFSGSRPHCSMLDTPASRSASPRAGSREMRS